MDGALRYGCGYRPNGQRLAAALATVNDVTRKVLTIEGPAEYQIDGTSQSRSGPCRLIAARWRWSPTPDCCSSNPGLDPEPREAGGRGASDAAGPRPGAARPTVRRRQPRVLVVGRTFQLTAS